MLAYGIEVYRALMEQYNVAIWPVQLVAWLTGALALALLARPSRRASMIIGMVLAAFWTWTGIAFYWITLTPLYFAAPVIAGLFVLQGLLCIFVVTRRHDLVFRFGNGVAGWVGTVLLAFAIAFYPMLCVMAGLDWVQTPMFGVTAPSTALFCLGMLLLARPRAPWALFIIPVIWTFYAGYVAWALPAHHDYALPVAGALAVMASLARLRPGA